MAREQDRVHIKQTRATRKLSPTIQQFSIQNEADKSGSFGRTLLKIVFRKRGLLLYQTLKEKEKEEGEGGEVEYDYV